MWSVLLAGKASSERRGPVCPSLTTGCSSAQHSRLTSLILPTGPSSMDGGLYAGVAVPSLTPVHRLLPAQALNPTQAPTTQDQGTRAVRRTMHKMSECVEDVGHETRDQGTRAVRQDA